MRVPDIIFIASYYNIVLSCDLSSCEKTSYSTYILAT